jgi:transposase
MRKRRGIVRIEETPKRAVTKEDRMRFAKGMTKYMSLEDIAAVFKVKIETVKEWLREAKKFSSNERAVQGG